MSQRLPRQSFPDEHAGNHRLGVTTPVSKTKRMSGSITLASLLMSRLTDVACSNITISVARGHPTRNRTGDSPRIHVSETSETKYHQPTRSLPAFSHVHLRTYNIRSQHPDKPSQRVSISAHYFARGPRTRAHLIPRRRCDGAEDSRRNHHFRPNYKSR